MSKVFVSYNRQSEELAKSLVEDLKALGHTVWFDRELSGGQAWWDQILGVVRDCDVFVFLLDPKSLGSTACNREFGYAAALGKPILPILAANGVATNLLPPELSRLQYVDYRQRDRSSALSLARALATIPPVGPLPDPLPAQPDLPASYLGSLTGKLDSDAPLSYEAQSAILVDLRRGLRDPETAPDASALLGKLRARRDLFAAIAEEIDVLRIAPRQPPPIAARIEDALQLAGAAIVKPAIAVAEPAAAKTVTVTDRLLGGLIGAVVAVVLGAITLSVDKASAEGGWSVGDIALFGGCFGGGLIIAGLLSGLNRSVMLTALAAIPMGFIIWNLGARAVDDDFNPFLVTESMTFGGSSGAILGAIVSRKIARRRLASINS